MTLKEIEEIVLSTIGYDKYSSLSVDTNPEKIEDFALLHKCVLFARDTIKEGTTIPALLKHASSITASLTQSQNTISDTDFDIPVVVRYVDSNGKYTKLTKTNPIELLDVVTNPDGQGDPLYYQMFGSTSAGLSYIEIFPIPSVVGTIKIDYKPVLTNLTNSTDEDIIMKKYPVTVANLASAYAFQLLKKDMVNCEKWMGLGISDFKNINLRELGSDYNEKIATEKYLATKRGQRLTT